MKLSGHKTRSVLDRPSIVSEEDPKDAPRKTEVYHDEQPVKELLVKPGEDVVPITKPKYRRDKSSLFLTGIVWAQLGPNQTKMGWLYFRQPLDLTGAGGRSRTDTGCEPRGILSPVRLPVSPLRHLVILGGKWRSE